MQVSILILRLGRLFALAPVFVALSYAADLFAQNKVFVTSTTFQANLGGVSAYDNQCNIRATAAGLNGTTNNDFIAWMSDGFSNAATRLGFAAQGFVRVDGAPVAPTGIASLAGLLNPIDRDEFGSVVYGAEVWTGTQPSGAGSGQHCANWTVNSGSSTQIGTTAGGPGLWTANFTTSCSGARRIYCFQKTKAQPITIEPPLARLAFVTAGTFTPSSGIAAAHNMCGSEATAAGLTGTWQALLSTTTASAVSLLTPAAVDYARVDGIKVSSYANLNAGSNPISGIWQTASGTYPSGASISVWTGSTTPNTVGTTASTCSDWMSSSASSTAVIGRATLMNGQWWNVSTTQGCSTPARLYCVQPAGTPTVPVPTGLTVTNVTGTGMTVSWTGASPQFRAIYKAGSVPASPTDGTLIIEGAQTSASVTGLAVNTRFFVAVYGKQNGTYSAAAATTSTTTNSTALISALGSTNGPWDRRTSPNRNGKFIFGDNAGNLKMFDGAAVLDVQPKGAFSTDPNTVFTLGTAADPAHVIAAWRRNDAYVSTDGATPFTINAANPVSPGTPMDAEYITVDGGCVFAVFRATSGGNDRRNAFRVDPANGNATALTSNTTVYGVVHMSSSGCKAAWAYDDGTGSVKLHYYNGSTVATIDQNIMGDPSISQGRIVYAKRVAAGNDEIFSYDTNLASPSPVQLTNDSTKNNESPYTDGRHAAWIRRNLNGTSPEIMLNGGWQLTSGNFALLENVAAPSFNLDRGQILWRDTSGVLHHETSSAGATVDTGGSATTSIPWLADGRVMFFDNTTSPRNIYRFSGQLPDDSLQPAAPMFLRATAGSGSVTLTWDKILGATSYNVYYATQPGLTKANYLSLGAAKVTGIVSSTHTVNGLDSNAAYYFIVTSVDENGEGPESRQASTVLFGSPTWTPVGSLSSVEILTVAADRIVGNNAYASGGNNTYATTNGGLTWTQLGGGIAGINVHSLGAHGNSVFATSQPGSVYRSTDAGGSWTNVASGTSGSFQQAIAIDPSFPTTILAGDIELSSYGGLGIDSRVIRSDDNGATWFHLPEFQPSGSLVSYSLAFDPSRTTTLFLGGNGTPNVAKSLAGGAGWLDRGLPTNGASSGHVYTVALDPQNSETIYAGTQSAFGGQTPGIWKSTDGGSTWTKLITGLPATTRVHSIVIDPAASNVLHLGTEAGYYYSINSGSNWTLLNAGLPNANATYINQLALTGSHRLIAATADGLYLLNLNSAPPPTVSVVSPSSGKIAGGTSVTITGMNFSSGATAEFGGSAASNIVFQNSTTITATVPAHAAGAVDVVVTNPDGQTGTKVAGFTYLATPPMITTHPASQSIPSGQTAMMTVAATGDGPLTYQWYIGNGGDTSNPIPGATSTSYTTAALTSTTSYWVRVSNLGGSADSATATITVMGSPSRRRGQIISI
jgi:hypothetical protein